MTINRRTFLQGSGAAGRRLGRSALPAIAQAQDEDPRRLPAHARGRRPDLARRSSRRLGEERPRARVQAVHDRPRAVPGDDRRQHRHALHRRGDLQLPGARPGQDVPRQRRRVRHRAALGARGQGVKTFADLKGKRIATTTGTTAHVFLDTALRANKIDPKDVEIVNQRMTEAVTSFISGAVPAVALWVPFNITVRDKVPGAKKLVDASAYYPEGRDRVGLGRHATSSTPRTARCWRAWSGPGRRATTMLHRQDRRGARDPAEEAVPAGAARRLQGAVRGAEGVPERRVAQAVRRRHGHQVAAAGDRLLRRFGNIPNPVPASQYFDPSIYMDTIKA